MEEKIIIKNDLGEEKEYSVILTFTKDGKEFVTYTDFEKDGNNIKCYSSIKDGDKLLPVTLEEDLDAIDELLKNMQETIKENFED